MLAALTSAAMPSIVVAGVFTGATHMHDIDQAQVRDAAGTLYDVYACDSERGRKLLAARVKAARTLMQTREPGGLGFSLGRALAFTPGDGTGPTGNTAVLVNMHQEGRERALDQLSLDECSSMGTAIGAIHRLQPGFLKEAGYPVFTTGQIRAQLTAWIKQLRNAGHVPSEITSSWARIIETEGLWSFSTTMVHGGFEDDDVKFNGSTITAINNWQNMQVNDPARDLAWIFSKLDEEHRNAVLTSYGRMMGNRLDDLIMLRANLWVQMAQVGDFIRALNRADNDAIIQFKAQVDRLAHQLGVSAHDVTESKGNSAAKRGDMPSTITVGTLLEDDARRRAEGNKRNARESDDTMDPDRTGSSQIAAAGHVDAPSSDDTADVDITLAHSRHADAPQTSATIILDELDDDTGNAASVVDADNTSERDVISQPAQETVEPNTNTSATEIIPLLERDERALRDAQAGLDETGEASTTPRA